LLTEEVICLAMKKIEELKWGEFKILDIFTISPGIRLTKADMLEGNTPFIGATDSNNGITTFCGNDNASRDCNVLGVNYNGSIVENFYHPYSALFSDDVKRLHLKDAEGNKYIYLFIKQCILKQKQKYEYGYKFNGERMKDQIILLPICEDGNPDYKYMEEYMKQVEKKLLTRYKNYIEKRELKNQNEEEKMKDCRWKEFFIEDVGLIMSGQDIYDRERIEGNNPYVTATALQNGIGYFVGNTNETLSEGCISINRNGSVGYAFYHPYKALFGNDTRRLIPECKKRWASFFITRAITQQKDKYGYGLKLGTDRLKKQIIMLPVNDNDEPDYEYMDEYMRGIEYRLINRYINNRLKTLKAG